MIRSELIQKIAEENANLTQRDAERIVNTVFEEITAALARGERVELRGFFGLRPLVNGPLRHGLQRGW